MGNNLFGANIAGILANQLGPLLLSGQLTKVIKGNRSATLTAGRQTTEEPHSFRGFYDDTQLRRLPDTQVQGGDRAVLILGDTLPDGITPEVNDKITLEGVEAQVQRLIDRDPDAATYTVQVRSTNV